MFKNLRRALWGIISFGMIGALVGCGGAIPAAINGADPLPAVAISITPQAMTITTGTTQAFTANITNSDVPTATWLIDGFVGGKLPNGTYPLGQIDNNGNYTAPQFVPNPSTLAITAYANADNSKTANATVSVVAGPLATTVTLSL